MEAKATLSFHILFQHQIGFVTLLRVFRKVSMYCISLVNPNSQRKHTLTFYLTPAWASVSSVGYRAGSDRHFLLFLLHSDDAHFACIIDAPPL